MNPIFLIHSCFCCRPFDLLGAAVAAPLSTYLSICLSIDRLINNLLEMSPVAYIKLL